MSVSVRAREVIFDTLKHNSNTCGLNASQMDFVADLVLRILGECGFVVCPKEPSEGMIAAAQDCDDPSEAALYKIMLLQAEKEGGQ